MHVVAIHGWKKEAPRVAELIAETLGILAFEARQKIAGGGPTVLTSFADAQRAEELVSRLIGNGIPAFVIDSATLSDQVKFHVRHLVLGAQGVQLVSVSAENCEIPYTSIELLLLATSSSGPTRSTNTITERKFSLGKTLATGGIPMSKKVTREDTVTSDQREEVLWLYTDGNPTMIFNRAAMNYDGLGAAMQMTRNLNFSYLKKELRRLAPQAIYDDRLLKRAGQIQLLGSALSPEPHSDLAFEVLARSLRLQCEIGPATF